MLEVTKELNCLRIIFKISSLVEMMVSFDNRHLLYLELIPITFIIAIFSFHTLLLLMWVIVLFKQWMQLRRKLKYSIEYISNQDTHLDALNTKVEYYKSLFLLAIVFIELISSIFSVAAGINQCVLINNYINNPTVLQNQTYPAYNMIFIKLFENFENTSFNCSNQESIVGEWESLNQFLSRVIYSLYELLFILGISPVYLLISYYAITIEKSLSYDMSLKSVELSRKQKYLILGSLIMFLFMLVLFVRIELTIPLNIFEIIVSILQLAFTYKYSRRMIRVFKWKILDTKIAFGINNFHYKSYTKTLSRFKLFLFLYSVVISSLCIYIILSSLMEIAIRTHPLELKRIFGFCLPLSQYAIHLYTQILIVFLYIISYGLIPPMLISMLFLLILNLATIPYLLSKINVNFHFKINFSKKTGNKDSMEIRQPLLK